jgi:hypothetical protein
MVGSELVGLNASLNHMLVIDSCVSPTTLLGRLLLLKHVGTLDKDMDVDESGPIS